jgi:hypothetical protein
VLTERVEGENAVSHAAGGGQFTVFDGEQVHERIGIDVVKVETGRDLGTLRAESSG